MGIVRTVEWKLMCLPAEADLRLRTAYANLGFMPEGPMGKVHGAARRSLRKNRWAADISSDIHQAADGNAIVVCRVDMAGNKHFAVMAELAEAVGDEVFSDRGVSAATERLGKLGRLFGRKEVRHMRNLLGAEEWVYELGQGQLGDKQGLLALTNTRLIFFEKSLGSESTDEFPIRSITSMSISKKMGGETLLVTTGGAASEIKKMQHGQGDAIARAFRQLSNETPPTPTVHLAPAAEASVDAIGQIERLAGLRDRGIISADEFEAKKAEMLGRM